MNSTDHQKLLELYLEYPELQLLEYQIKEHQQLTWADLIQQTEQVINEANLVLNKINQRKSK